VAQGATSNVADPTAIVQGITSNVPVPVIGASLAAEKSKDTDLQASRLPVTPEVNAPAIVPGVTPAVHVPAVDPSAVVQGATSNVADPNAIAQRITSGVELPIFAQEPTETKSTQAGDNTLLASSATPSWCNDIPSAGQQYIAACGGSADENGQSSTGGGMPSWCENVPAVSRADIPACANQDNAPLSASVRLAGSPAVFLVPLGILCGAVAHA